MCGCFMPCVAKKKRDQFARMHLINLLTSLLSQSVEQNLFLEQVYNAETTETAEAQRSFEDSKDRDIVLVYSNAAETHKCKLMVFVKVQVPEIIKL